MRKHAGPLVFFITLTLASCAPGPEPAKIAPAKMPSKETEYSLWVEEIHAKVFRDLGGYRGASACHACHSKELDALKKSYHVHQGRITKDGKIADDPKDAADTGMYVRWYPLSNLPRSQEPENMWRAMEASFCSQCHPGGGPMARYKMDVDCLICHQRSGYRGGSGLGDYPAGVDREGNPVMSDGGRLVAIMMEGARVAGRAEGLDFSNLARVAMKGVELRVGRPTPDNCNFCHWRTHGKRGTRYGMFKGRAYDVHYTKGIYCQDCHITQDHQMGKGKVLDAIGTPELHDTMFTCFECHGEEPHNRSGYSEELRDHAKRIACETCHTPKTQRAAKAVNWAIGMDIESLMKSYHLMMPIAKIFGMATPKHMTGKIQKLVDCYKEMKGAGFRPSYAWHNRKKTASEIPQPIGSIHDPESKITPFNVVLVTYYDEGRDPRVLANPASSLNGNPIPKAYAYRAGGKGKKVPTEAQMRGYMDGRYPNAFLRKLPMYFQVFHSIKPAEDAVSCNRCHTDNDPLLDFRALGYSAQDAADLQIPR